ncbi:MAG TPA: TetR/AcrR family transcriptional regulator [Candidatus Limnocylindrales bacterium]
MQDEPKRGPGRPRTRAKALELRASDPLASLPPTALRLLDASRRILVREGFSALSLAAVAEEAGESKASIGYHFGGKDGLIVALVDSLVHEANRSLVTETNVYPMGEQRLRVLMEGELRIIEDSASFVALLEILPYAMRDEPLRSRIADLYIGYRDTVLTALNVQDDPQRAPLASFASLTIAVVDGLAIQHGLDPARVDIEAATLLWLKMARCLLGELGLVDMG